MKLISTTLLLTIVSIGYFGLTSFKPASKNKAFFEGEYNVQLISNQQTGSNFEWVWTVTNPNPGNGTNGTMQNLSHWSLAISDMVRIDQIVAVQYSSDGQSWQSLPVVYAIDKSQECFGTTVLKFDRGTSGGEPSYYRIVTNTDFPMGYSTANFKSGQRTGCYNGQVMGIGEPPADEPTEK